jgi:hypothetical protein
LKADATLLYDPARHEPLRPLAWDESAARATIERIVADTRSRYTEDAYWPQHPLDRDGDDGDRIQTSLYFGACGVFWALDYLAAVGAVAPAADHSAEFGRLLARNRRWLGDAATRERASLLMGDTPIRLMQFGANPSSELEEALDELIAGNIGHPSRELMWGAPGTLLAASFLHERTGDERWAEYFRATARKLWAQLEWSTRHQCAYWTQELYGWRCTYLDAVHGFVGTALPLIRSRHLLGPAAWAAWEQRIVETVHRTCDRVGEQANWRPQLNDAPGASFIRCPQIAS